MRLDRKSRFVIFTIYLWLFACFGTPACSRGDDDDSGGSGEPGITDDDDTSADDDDTHPVDDDTDDDFDDDADDDSDDDADDDTGDGHAWIPGICVEEWNDVGECPRGFLTPEGACIERIAGGGPGREGVSIAVGPDNLSYVAAVKGRDLRLYKIDGSGPEITCTVRTIDFMAAGPSMAMDAEGHFHIAYTNLLNDGLKYATDATGAWTFEDVAPVGPERHYYDEIVYHAHASITVGPEGEPHIAYINLWDADLRYARKDGGTWADEAVITQDTMGAETDIAIDPSGAAHIVARSAKDLGSAFMVYATNKTGTWTITGPASGNARHPSVAADADGNAHIAVFLAQSLFFRLTYVTNKTGSWTTKIVGVSATGQAPSIVIDLAGAAHIADDIVYYDDKAERYGIGYFTNASGTWVSEVAEADVSSAFELFTLAMDANGEPRIASYHQDDGDNDTRGMRFATRESGTWAAARLDTGADNGRGVWWGMDDAGGQHVLYTNHHFHYEYGFRPSAADNWMYEEILEDFDPSYASDTALVVDGAGVGYLVFGFQSDSAYATNESGLWIGRRIYETPNDSFGENYARHPSGLEAISVIQYDEGLYVATPGEDAWAFGVVDPRASYPYRASIVFDHAGYLHLAYGRSDGIVYTTNASGTWESEVADPLTVLPDGTPMLLVIVTVDSFDRPHLFYSDDDTTYYAEKIGGTWDIAELGAGSGSITTDVGPDDTFHIFGTLSQEEYVWYATNSTNDWAMQELGDRCALVTSATVRSDAAHAACQGLKGEVNLVSVPIE
ncbi:MAG: hypothetical protein M5R36_05170 [Deltaproteobacteria bacterium]|nr:hypothetical protein [Deltaproteobacteria bacterium]